MNTDDELIQDICEALTDVPDPLFVQKLRAAGLTDAQILIVMQAVNSTCHECWNANVPCNCWNDE